MATRTITGTWFRPILTDADIKLLIFETNKYDANNENYEEITITDVKEFTIVEGGEEAEAIKALGVAEDINNDYLILRYADGHIDIYPNTKVALFVL